jgi:tetratricopeptide (TPR) repeat protein
MPRIVLSLCLMIALAFGTSAIVRAEDSATSLRSLVADAAAAQARRDFSSAADAYRKATKLAPSSPELWTNLGLMDHEIGNSSEAMADFQRAVRLNPSLFVPQLFLGIEYLAGKNPAAALPHLETAERLNPGDLQTVLSLGSAYAKLDRSERATEAYLRATEIAPENGNAWLDLGTSYLQQVEDDARVMTSTYRNSSYVKLRAAETLADEGSLNAAANWYNETIASALAAPCAHAEFGITLLSLKRVADAEAQFHLEERTASPCGLARLGVAIAAAAEGHSDVGLAKLTELAEKDPAFVQSSLPLFRGALSSDEVRSLVRLARQRRGTGDRAFDAASLIETAFASRDVSPEAAGSEEAILQTQQISQSDTPAHLYATSQYTRCDDTLKPAIAKLADAQRRLLTSCSFYAGDFMTASRTAALLKTNSATRLEGLYWESKADEKLAVAALARAGEIEPDSPRMHVLLGDVYRQKRHWSEAESEYRRATSLNPKSRAARLSLAIVLFTEMKTDEAFAIDKALLEEMPNDPEANLLAADILVQKHEFQQAEPYLAECKNLKVDLLPRYHLLLGRVYAATERIPAAISEYRLGLSSDQDGGIHYQLSRLYQKVGDKADAEKEIRISQEVRERWDRQARIDLGQSQAQAMSQ